MRQRTWFLSTRQRLHSGFYASLLFKFAFHSEHPILA
jgi:hypothetical protein